MKQSRWLVVLLMVLTSTLCFAGPFGFERGMTKQQVIALIGKAAVQKNDGDVLVVSASPKPNQSMESFVLVISPDDGLLKIIANGRTIQTSVYGTELKSEFNSIKEALTTKCKQPSHEFDFLEVGSIWNEPNDWMMGLLKKERHLATSWEVSGAANLREEFRRDRIHLIAADTKGQDRNAGWVTVTYEFDGFEAYIDKLNTKKSDTF